MGITHNDDNIKEISPFDKSLMVPQKHQQVGQSVAQNVTWSASKVGEAAVLDAAELQLIELCLGKPITPTDAEAEDSPMKATTKQKKKHSQKEWDQSCGRRWETLSESDSSAHHLAPQQNPTKAKQEGRSEICDMI